jgi:hypothetical protein
MEGERELCGDALIRGMLLVAISPFLKKHRCKILLPV